MDEGEKQRAVLLEQFRAAQYCWGELCAELWKGDLPRVGSLRWDTMHMAAGSLSAEAAALLSQPKEMYQKAAKI